MARSRLLLGGGLLAGAALVTAVQASNGFNNVGVDFLARYAGGRVVALGGSPYDHPTVFAEQRHLGTSASTLILRDAPPVYGIFRILSNLSLHHAATLWFVISIVALGLFAAYLARHGGRWLMVLAFPCLVTFVPAREALRLGQTDVVFIGFLVAVAWWAERHPRDGREGTGVPFVVLKPQTMLLPMAYSGVRAVRAAPVRAIAGAAIGVAALVAFAAVTVPEGSWADWLHQVGGRPADRSGATVVALFVLVSIGIAILVRGLLRARRRSVTLDAIAVASAANVLLAVTGSWNPQWFLAMAIPLGMLLVAVRTGGIRLTRGQGALLLVACGVAAGDGYTPLVAKASYAHAQVIAPIIAVALLAAGLTVLREISAVTAAAFFAVNLVATSLPYGVDWQPVVAVAVGEVLLYLVFECGTAVGVDREPRVATPLWLNATRPADAIVTT